MCESIFQSSPIAMAVMTAGGNWIAVNPAFRTLFGYSPDEPVERTLRDSIDPNDVPEVSRLLSQLNRGEISYFQRDVCCVRKCGSPTWAQLTIHCIDLPGEQKLFAVNVQDITRRKDAEQAREHSAALIRSIGENAGDLILVVGLPGLEVLYASPAFESLLGYSSARLSGSDSLKLLHPDDWMVVRQTVEQMSANKLDSSIIMVRYIHADGSPHYVEAHGCAVRNANGQIVRIVVIGRMIDDRIETDRKLAASERRLQTLLDSTAEGIYGLDRNGTCTFCNAACLKMLGYGRPEAMLGKNVHQLIHHSHADGAKFPQEECRVASTLGHGRLVHVEDEILWRADGSYFTAEFWSHPIYDGRELAGCVVTFVDITTRKEAESALRNAHRDAEQFIDSVPSILIGLDAEGRIERWNLAATQTFGLSRGDVHGRLLSSCGIQWLGDLNDALKSLAGTDQLTVDSLRFNRNGEERSLGLTIRRIKSYEDVRLEFLIVGADITERKRAAEELLWKTAFLEAQTNSTEDGILVVGPDGRRILQNRRLLELFKVPPEIAATVGDDALLGFVLPKVKQRDCFLEKVRYLYEHRDQISYDEIEFTDGMVFDRYTSPVLGPHGEYYGRIWTFRDTTHKKKTQDLLQQLSLAVEQSPVSIVITDLDGRITYVNRKFCEASGYNAGELVGRNPRILKSGRTSQEEYKRLWEAVASGKEWRGVFHNRKKNGETYCETAVIRPIQGSNGVISHFLGVKEDITEKLALEAQLRQAQKLEAIGQLAAGIAHEINTPMQYIGDNTRFLETTWASLQTIFERLSQTTGDSPESAAEALKDLVRIRDAADLEYLNSEVPSAIQQSLEGIQRVTKIVQAMKEFSHPGAEKKVPADINKAIETTVTVARNEWKYVSELKTILDDSLGPVPCLIGEFNQVILNLIINASHAIADVVGDGSQSKGKITIRTARKGDEAEISIEDTGGGIPDEIRSRIFEPFFTTKAPGKGTGQGLALAHNTIVEKHGGRIWFDSEPGKGTTFFIRLPIR